MEAVGKLVPYELVDIGANLGHPLFKSDLDDVLMRAKQSGISKLMITGTCEKISKESMKLAETMPGFLYFTAGVHPHDAKDFDNNTLDNLRALQAHAQCVAVGECGLDFNRNFSPQDVQKDVFAKQDRLTNGVQTALRNGAIPLDRLLIETDAPFMYPKINDKKLPADVKEAFSEPTKQLHKFTSFNRNEPCALAAVCEMIAAFMGRDPQEASFCQASLILCPFTVLNAHVAVAEVTTANAKKVYGLH
ncbi:hydrolase, TatD family [Teladorsagia circumcincta]|uniref:Deoxyribonuclease TATDN1 n=1 Tax=Teladorsagia circumcincta TaxID=45464 RepID=A0A2G9UWH2_TELCI|nr:hydrolase, TatD family [Teladorsagia circumcincta]